DQYVEGVTGFAFQDSSAFNQIMHYIYDKKQALSDSKAFKEKISSTALQDNYQTMTQRILEVYQHVLRSV
ncbi:MAG: glycosyltransferase, partial [Treponema sp.]